MPNDNIQRIIKRAEGGDKTEYEAITYEGYGPGGVAVMVETLTDNRNRTAADMRHYFDKNGGNLGQMGCVGFMFSQKGVIDISLEDKDADELMMDALDAGAEDFDAGEDAAEVTTDPENFTAVVKALEKKGYKFISADVAQVPSTTTRLTDPDQSSRWASCWTPWTTTMMSRTPGTPSRTKKTWIAKPQECQKRVKGDFCSLFCTAER